MINPLGVLLALIGVVLIYLGMTGKYKAPAVKNTVAGKAKG